MFFHKEAFIFSMFSLSLCFASLPSAVCKDRVLTPSMLHFYSTYALLNFSSLARRRRTLDVLHILPVSGSINLPKCNRPFVSFQIQPRRMRCQVCSRSKLRCRVRTLRGAECECAVDSSRTLANCSSSHFCQRSLTHSHNISLLLAAAALIAAAQHRPHPR